MPYRLTKIYTRKGDAGYTMLADKSLPKDDALIDALGNVDELNSVIGLVISFGIHDQKIADCLTHIQNELFNLGGELHCPERIAITAEKVVELETALDNWNQHLPPLKEFILPRGNPPTAACHVARTVCRRAERSMVTLNRQATLNNPQILRYLNRLSDLLFVIARVLAKTTHEKEILWEHETKSTSSKKTD